MIDEAGGERMRALRAKLGLSQRQLAKRLRISNQAVSRWEQGQAMPKLSTAQQLSQMADVPVEWILSGAGSPTTGERGSSNVVYSSAKGRQVPLMGDTDLGILPAKLRKRASFVQTHFQCSAQSVALEVRGSSMAPDFHDGDIVIVDPEMKPQPGDFVFVEMADGTMLFRKYRPQSLHAAIAKVYDLVPSNPDWPTVRVSSDNKGKIAGVMSEHITPPRKQGS